MAATLTLGVGRQLPEGMSQGDFSDLRWHCASGPGEHRFRAPDAALWRTRGLDKGPERRLIGGNPVSEWVNTVLAAISRLASGIQRRQLLREGQL